LREGSATPLLLRSEVDFTFEDAEVEFTEEDNLLEGCATPLLLRSAVDFSLDPDELLILRSDFAVAMGVFWSEIDFSPEVEMLLLLPLVTFSG
jgi:hypothetical protein